MSTELTSFPTNHLDSQRSTFQILFQDVVEQDDEDEALLPPPDNAPLLPPSNPTQADIRNYELLYVEIFKGVFFKRK